MILIKGAPMPAKEEKAPADNAQDMDNVVRLFDLHLGASKRVEKAASRERWPPLMAIAFIFGTSLVLWALIIALVCYLL